MNTVIKLLRSSLYLGYWRFVMKQMQHSRKIMGIRFFATSGRRRRNRTWADPGVSSSQEFERLINFCAISWADEGSKLPGGHGHERTKAPWPVPTFYGPPLEEDSCVEIVSGIILVDESFWFLCFPWVVDLTSRP